MIALNNGLVVWYINTLNCKGILYFAFIGVMLPRLIENFRFHLTPFEVFLYHRNQFVCSFFCCYDFSYFRLLV